mmetsp:Transcript_10154/g.31505  ORF Transcript_10154/g.31505 Transcript_10154/m.31505 type:complete len:274 (-) Transcript_10154:1459-2280(-)
MPRESASCIAKSHARSRRCASSVMARTLRISSLKCSSVSTAAAPLSLTVAAPAACSTSRGPGTASLGGSSASRGGCTLALPPPGPSVWLAGLGVGERPGHAWHWRASTMRSALLWSSPASKAVPAPPLHQDFLILSRSSACSVHWRSSKPCSAHHANARPSALEAPDCEPSEIGKAAVPGASTATQSLTAAAAPLLSSLLPWPVSSHAPRSSRSLAAHTHSYALQADAKVSGRQGSKTRMSASADWRIAREGTAEAGASPTHVSTASKRSLAL